MVARRFTEVGTMKELLRSVASLKYDLTTRNLKRVFF